MKTATRRVGLGLVAATLVFAGSAAPSRAETHRLKPSVGYPTFAVRPPVLTVKPGDLVETESLWGEWYEKEGGQWPGEVGPIAVEGALSRGHPGGGDPQGPPQSRHGRVHPGRTLRRARARRGHGVPQRPLPSRPLRLAPRPRTHDGHGRPAGQHDEARHHPPAPDAGPGGGGARGRRSVRRPLARPLRRQHGRLGRARGHHRVPSRLPRGRPLLLRRRPRGHGRRGSLRLRPRDLDGRDPALRPGQGSEDRLAALRGRRVPHGRRAARGP